MNILPRLVACLVVSLTLGAVAAEVPEQYKSAVAATLAIAGDNAAQLTKALDSAKPEHRAAVAFLVANMPERDAKSLSAKFLLQNVELAYKARESTPWGKSIPGDLFLNDVL